MTKTAASAERGEYKLNLPRCTRRADSEEGKKLNSSHAQAKALKHSQRGNEPGSSPQEPFDLLAEAPTEEPLFCLQWVHF